MLAERRVWFIDSLFDFYVCEIYQRTASIIQHRVRRSTIIAPIYFEIKMKGQANMYDVRIDNLKSSAANVSKNT